MQVLLYGILMIAIITDFKNYKIPNTLIIVGLVVGSFLKGICNGPPGFFKTVSDALIVMVVLIPFFIIKALGAGDIKLFSVIAGYIGIKQTEKIVIIALILGAILGILKIIILNISKKFQINSTVKKINVKKDVNTTRVINLLENILSNIGLFKFSCIIGNLKNQFECHIIHFSLPIFISTIFVMEGVL